MPLPRGALSLSEAFDEEPDIQAAVTINEQAECGEIAQRPDERHMPECVQRFISQPGWVLRDD
jgi:hypothetical protein